LAPPHRRICFKAVFLDDKTAKTAAERSSFKLHRVQCVMKFAAAAGVHCLHAGDGHASLYVLLPRVQAGDVLEKLLQKAAKLSIFYPATFKCFGTLFFFNSSQNAQK
jgi:hypothetical protein